MQANSFRNSWQLRPVPSVEQSTTRVIRASEAPRGVHVCQRWLLRLIDKHTTDVREARVRATDPLVYLNDTEVRNNTQLLE
jgi:hypothetical protein